LGAFLSPVLGGPARNPIVLNTPTYVNERDFEALSPRASVSYKFNEDLTAYASYNRGFKSGGFDMRGDARLFPATVNGYDPEYVDSFELGLKGSLWDRRVTFATDVFYALYEDVQVTTQYPSALGIASVVDNVGKATFYGWEFEGSARITDNFRAFVALGYIHGQYDEFLAFVPGAPGNGQACAPNPPSPPNAAGCFVDLSGVRDIQNTPDWTGSFSFTWTHDIAGGQLAFTPLVAYRGAFQMFEAASPLDQDGYWLVDANLSWTSGDGRYTLGLHGKNLTDETYRTGGYFFPGAAVFGDSITAFYGAPRTVSVSLDVRL
jgi:iron complex outermembrane receptor protein